MRKWFPLFLVISLAIWNGPAFPKETEYFPSSLRTSTYACNFGFSRYPIIDKLEVDWYSKHLRAANEPSLYAQSISHGTDPRTSYRFTWLRSFHAPIMVRVDERADGNMQLLATQLSGAGGYDPGRVKSTVQRMLTKAERDKLHRLRANGVTRLKSKDCTQGLDGAVWIIEIRDGDGYHYINRWSPEDGPVRDFGLLLLRFTGWNTDPLY